MRGREVLGDDIAGFTEVLAMVGPKSGAPGPGPGRENGRKVSLGECFWLEERANEVADLLVVKSEQIHYKKRDERIKGRRPRCGSDRPLSCPPWRRRRGSGRTSCGSLHDVTRLR